MKKIIMMIIIGIMLNSCGMLRYGIEKTNFEIEQDKDEREATKKDGPSAITIDKYRSGVEDAIKDILKRPINKRVQFGEITLIIPENTTLNSKQGNIVDMKTGYGILLYFVKENYCIGYVKQKNDKYYRVVYRDSTNALAQKIIKVNGFTKTCN